MKTQIFKFHILLILFTLLFSLFTDKAHAAISLGVSPPLLNITAEPPAQIQSEITVQNLEAEPVSLDILLKPFTASDKEDGSIRFLDKEESFGADPLLLQRVSILDGNRKVDEVFLGPKQQKTLKVHIAIPEDSPLSDYYFSIVFASKNIGAGEATASENQAGIAVNVLLTVGPLGKAEGTLETFSTPFFVERGPVPFLVRLKNTGAFAVAPEGQILIKNMFGQLVGKVDLAQMNILSETTRALTDAQQADTTQSQASNIQLPASKHPTAYWYEGFLFGPYTATLRVALTDKGPLIERSITFIAFPIQALIGVVMTVLLVIWVKQRIEYRKRHQIK